MQRNDWEYLIRENQVSEGNSENRTELISKETGFFRSNQKHKSTDRGKTINPKKD